MVLVELEATKFIARLYETYMRSILVYGSESLTLDERKTLLELDDVLVWTYLKGLLKLRSIAIAGKHKHRLMLLLRLPTMEMELERRCMGRVEAWAKRSGCEKEKVALHAKRSLADVNILQERHPLKTARVQLEAEEVTRTLRLKQWDTLETDSKSKNKTTSRHITVKKAGVVDKSEQFRRFLKDVKLDPALKRTMLRWSIYNYPVRYKPS